MEAKVGREGLKGSLEGTVGKGRLERKVEWKVGKEDWKGRLEGKVRRKIVREGWKGRLEWKVRKEG